MPRSQTSLVTQWLTEALCFHCRRHGFSLWLAKFHPPCSLAEQKRKTAHSHHCGNPLPHWHPTSPLLPKGDQCSQLCAKYHPPDIQELLFHVWQNKDTSKFYMFLKCIYVLSTVFLCYLPFFTFFFFFEIYPCWCLKIWSWVTDRILHCCTVLHRILCDVCFFPPRSC